MPRNPTAHLVHIQSSGVELTARLILSKKLTRGEMKLNTLEKYVQKHPTGWKKRLELAELLYSMGWWEQAIAQYRQVLSQQPQSLAVHLQLGKIFHLTARDTEAIKNYDNALAIADNLATKHHIAGLMAVCGKSDRQAAIAFESALALEPHNLAHWHALGKVYLSLEDPIAALTAFDAILAIDPDDIIALHYSYDALVAAGNLAEAQRRLDKAIELAPQDSGTLERLAHKRLCLGLVRGAGGKQTKQIIHTLRLLTPNAASGEGLLASYYIRRGEVATGIALMQAWLEMHPNHPYGWYYYARCLYQSGDLPNAAEAILKAYQLYRKDSEIYRAMCEILPAAGRLELLPAIAEEMLQLFPEKWSMAIAAGKVLVEYLKDRERGCTIAARGTQLQPNLAGTWFQYSLVLALAGRHQEAVEALDRGWQLLPPDADLSAIAPCCCAIEREFGRWARH